MHCPLWNSFMHVYNVQWSCQGNETISMTSFISLCWEYWKSCILAILEYTITYFWGVMKESNGWGEFKYDIFDISYIRTFVNTPMSSHTT
jgi:hypothetical protein